MAVIVKKYTYIEKIILPNLEIMWIQKSSKMRKSMRWQDNRCERFVMCILVFDVLKKKT